MAALTEREKRDYVEQALDPNKVVLVCSRHRYAGGDPSQRPTPGCYECNYVWLTYHFAKIPPHQRAEKLEEMTRAIVDACALEDRGKFDFQPFEHPQVKIEHE